jgi:signal transduction histidine kinase/PAS domain-containing protein
LIKSFLKNNYIIIIVAVFSFIGLYFVSLYSYLLYHSLVEFFTIAISFLIFVIAWNSKKYLDNNFLLFIGITYFFIGLLDLFHTLAYGGMHVFPSFTGANLGGQLWIAARYMESISLLLALLFITRKLNYKLQFILYSIITILILLTIFYWEIFPVTFIEGLGLTTFKIVSEYVISAILLLVIFLLHLYRKEFSRNIFMLINISLFLTILSELSFTLYVDIYGLFNQIGHFLKLLSFLLIYKALVETGFLDPINLLFFKLKQKEKEIQESEEKYHSLYSSMNEGVCLHEIIYDETKKPIDYRIIDVNNAYESITKLQKDQVINKKASEAYKTGYAPYLDIFAEVVHSRIPIKFETYFQPMEKYFSISVFSLSKRRFATIFSDITIRKLNEKEIESLSRFTSENPNPVMRINNKKIVVYANDPAKALMNKMDIKKKNSFLKILVDSNSLSKKGNDKFKVKELRLGSLIYEFIIVEVEGSDYFNVYGKDVTNIKKAEIMKQNIEKEKSLKEEREKIARELHDTVTQTLFSANMTAETIPKVWEKDPDAAMDRLELLKKLNTAALMEMRVLLYELRPSVLKEEKFIDLLHRLVESARTRSKIQIEFIANGEYRFPPKIELAFFRIAQEALINITKHSHATSASVILKILPEKLTMIISDNGYGFDLKKIPATHLGLSIITERAKRIKASLSIDSLEGNGTEITVIYNKKQKKKS